MNLKAERQQMVLKGRLGLQRSLALHPKPFANLKKEDLKVEVTGRGLQVDDEKKECYQKALTSELAGQCRVPAFFNPPKTTLEDLGVCKYEILPYEPMHDLSNHITNLLDELPNHVSKDEASVIQECKDLTVGQKEKKSAFDIHCLIITISSQLRGKAPLKVRQLIDTLVQMAEILYKPDKDVSPCLILRYHNLSFYHAILCLEVIGTQPVTLTRRKLYGKYYHGLIQHAPIQLRIISGESSNAEDEERYFITITRETSSQHPSHKIGNIIRIQAEHSFNEQFNITRENQESNVKRLAKSLPDFPDTLFQPFVLQKYKRQWQAHLERISDFLLPGHRLWWEFDGENVIFHDSAEHIDACPPDPTLHHFRSSSLKEEESYLKECWQECLDKWICIPAHCLYTEDPENADKVRRIKTNFLIDQVNMENDTGTAFGETNGQEDSGNNDDQNGDNSEINFLPVVAAAATDDDYNENEVVISVNVTSPDDEETLISDDVPSLGNGEIQVTSCSHQEVSEAT